VFENGAKKDEVIGDWRKLHNEELHNLYSSPIIRVIRNMKSSRIRWVRHVAGVYDKNNAYRTNIDH
jgi:hypothetical protein